MERLYEYMRRQLEYAPEAFTRYLYERINWDARMIGIMGPRGVGKTTLFLQHIKKRHLLNSALYVSADHIYFTEHTLFDTAEAFYKNGGTHLFIDEVHKYPDWSRELKMMYDSLPDLNILFTGSSTLDIRKGEADLSRRATLYHLQGLSFREFLAMRHGIHAPTLTLEDILQQRAELPGVKHPLPLFKEYLSSGYYPFGNEPDFETKLEQVITQTLEVDIPRVSGMSAATGRKLLKLMSIISGIAPFKPNLTSLGSQIGASRNLLGNYLNDMEHAGMIAQLHTSASGLGALGKAEKIYLDNTNIMHVLAAGRPDVGSARETFFFNQMRVGHTVLASPISDFAIGDVTFEIGGKNKGGDQLKGTERGYIASDDLEYGHGSVVPLWAFGLTY